MGYRAIDARSVAEGFGGCKTYDHLRTPWSVRPPDNGLASGHVAALQAEWYRGAHALRTDNGGGR
ncbi:MAG: hypothetical protein WKF84_00820 [Pyrinomonadaceae bacterium]